MSILDQYFVYHPEPWQDRDWARLSGLPLEDVWFQAADGVRLFGWYVEAQADRPVILWCHGNAGTIINRLENLKLLYRLGFSVFLFDYRGYGRSQGRPSEEGLYQDAFGAHDYLTRTRMIRSERIIIFGRSLGAAVAGELAVQKPAAGLILESAFPSIEAVAKFHYGGLPVHWLLGADFTLIDRLAETAQALRVHAEQVGGDGDRVERFGRIPDALLPGPGGAGAGPVRTIPRSARPRRRRALLHLAVDSMGTDAPEPSCWLLTSI